MTTSNEDFQNTIKALTAAYEDSEISTAVKHVGMAISDVLTSASYFLDLAVEYTSNGVIEDEFSSSQEASEPPMNRDAKLDTYFAALENQLKNTFSDFLKDRPGHE